MVLPAGRDVSYMVLLEGMLVIMVLLGKGC